MVDPKPQEKRTINWVRILLIVSLTFNLLVVGLFIGAWISSGSFEKQAASNFRGLSMGPYGRALSREDRKAIGAALRAQRADLLSTRKAMRDLGLQMVQALRAEPYDAAVVSEIFEQQKKHGAQLLGMGQDALMMRIDAMQDRERADFADRLEKVFKRGRRDERK